MQAISKTITIFHEEVLKSAYNHVIINIELIPECCFIFKLCGSRSNK